MSEYIIKGRDMSDAMVEDVISLTKEAFKNFEVFKDKAEYIKTECDNKFGSTWHCIIGKDFGSFVTYQSQHFVHFTMDGLSVLLYKTK